MLFLLLLFMIFPRQIEKHVCSIKEVVFLSSLPTLLPTPNISTRIDPSISIQNDNHWGNKCFRNLRIRLTTFAISNFLYQLSLFLSNFTYQGEVSMGLQRWISSLEKLSHFMHSILEVEVLDHGDSLFRVVFLHATYTCLGYIPTHPYFYSSYHRAWLVKKVTVGCWRRRLYMEQRINS